jgi:predicted secreted protein
MSAFRNLEIFIAVLLTVFAVLPFSFQSLLRDQDSGFRLAIARSAQDAKGLTYLESLQVAFVSSAIYSGFIAVFQGLRLTDRLCLAGSNLICFSLLVLVVSPAIVFTALHFPFRGFRLLALSESAE